jgi:hypothetical protein
VSVATLGDVGAGEEEEEEERMTLFAHLRHLFSGHGWNGNWGVSREALSQLGVGTLLAYGFVSNVCTVTIFIMAWVAHGKSSGLSPLAPHQKKPFLLIYAGLYACSSMLRPLRATLAVALTPAYTMALDSIQKRTGLKRGQAVGVLVFVVNIIGTTSVCTLGLIAATKLAGVPLLP